MGGGATAKDHPWEYLGASALAATLNYPLWRASAVGQSGFAVQPVIVAGQAIRAPWSTYVYAFLPPYKGGLATVLGMTWARAAIFWGSDYGRQWLKQQQDTTTTATTPRQPRLPEWIATVLPPLLVSTAVQCINMPLVRATITLQNPSNACTTVRESMRLIYQQHGGVAGLWHGTSAGILKTVPKYCTAVVVKDALDDRLPAAHTPAQGLQRSALKSAAAGVAGAALTNPLDVIRNEMFKTNRGLVETVQHLYQTEGWSFVTRGLGKNLVAVAIPVACTIFLTDALIQMTTNNARQDRHLGGARIQQKEEEKESLPSTRL